MSRLDSLAQRARSIGLRTEPAPWRFVLTTLLVYALVLAVLLWLHEPWRDEADAWLAARDLDLGSLRAFTANAGTPALWYALLAPLARLGLPYGAMFVLHGALAVVAVGVLLRWGPFPRGLKLLLAFSFLFAYEYAVVARSYVLTELLLFVLAALEGRREPAPLARGLALGLLGNTNAFGACFAAGIGGVHAVRLLRSRRDDPRERMGLTLAVGLGCLALWQLWPTGQDQFAGQTQIFSPALLLHQARAAFLPLAEPGAERALGLPLGVAILGLGGLWLLRRPAALAPFAFGLACLAAVFLTKITASLRHVGLIQLLFVYALWTSSAAAPRDWLGARASAWVRRHELRGLRTALLAWAVCLVASLPATVELGVASLRYAGSGAEEMGRRMRALGISRFPVVAHRASTCMAVLPYLERRTLWYAGLEADGSHMRWDATFARAETVPYPEALSRGAARFGPHKALYLLDRPLTPAEAPGYVLLAATREHVWRHPEERFYLYWNPPPEPPR